MKIEAYGVIAIIRDDKVIFSQKGSDRHFTFHFGPSSRVFDVHETMVTDKGKTYRTLLKLPHDEALVELERFQHDFLRLLLGSYKKLDIRSLSRRNISALVLYHPPEGNSEAFTTKAKGRIRIDERKILDEMWVPDGLHQLHKIKKNEYFILYTKRERGRAIRIGSGFKYKDTQGRDQLVWITDKSIESLILKTQKRLDRYFITEQLPHTSEQGQDPRNFNADK